MVDEERGHEIRPAFAAYLPNGIDLRLYDGVELRHTKLCKDGPDVYALAEQWRTALLERSLTNQ